MLQATVRHLADVGLAFDGDGDRVVLGDERGQLLDGDNVMLICAAHYHAHGRLAENTLVATVMSNFGLEVALRHLGLKLVRCKVGDRYVWEKMQEVGASLGGEQAGHVIFRDYATTGDGLVTALEVLRVMLETGQPLSALAAGLEKMPQVLVNITVREKRRFEDMPAVAAAIQSAEEALGANGRVLVRYSGTEALARVMIEGPSDDHIQHLAEAIAAPIRQEIGA
jgi:phosphoglucosamine mutase